jgi:hypothetical protein
LDLTDQRRIKRKRLERDLTGKVLELEIETMHADADKVAALASRDKLSAARTALARFNEKWNR